MFNEIGKKIKGVANVVCWIQIIVAIIGGIALMTIDENLILVGFLVMGIGCLIAWLGTIVLYGFGELIDKVSNIENTLTHGNTANKPVQNTQSNQSTKGSSNTKFENQQRALGKCEMCNSENVTVCEVKIIDDMGVRYRNVCKDCFNRLSGNVSGEDLI